MSNGFASHGSTIARPTDGRAFPGILLIAGGLGVVATSVLYAVSPPDVLPTLGLDVAAATSGIVAGAARMRAAGSIGVASDMITIVAIVGILLAAGRERRNLSTAGWAALLLSVVIFTLVDTMFGFVLVPVGADQAAPQAFIVAKRLFDALFLVGTATVGIGLLGVVAGALLEPGSSFGRATMIAGAFVGVAALVCAMGSLAGIAFQQGAGLSILFSGIVLALMGNAIRRQALIGEP